MIKATRHRTSKGAQFNRSRVIILCFSKKVAVELFANAYPSYRERKLLPLNDHVKKTLDKEVALIQLSEREREIIHSYLNI